MQVLHVRPTLYATFRVCLLNFVCIHVGHLDAVTRPLVLDGRCQATSTVDRRLHLVEVVVP